MKIPRQHYPITYDDLTPSHQLAYEFGVCDTEKRLKAEIAELKDYIKELTKINDDLTKDWLRFFEKLKTL